MEWIWTSTGHANNGKILHLHYIYRQVFHRQAVCVDFTKIIFANIVVAFFASDAFNASSGVRYYFKFGLLEQQKYLHYFMMMVQTNPRAVLFFLHVDI